MQEYTTFKSVYCSSITSSVIANNNNLYISGKNTAFHNWTPTLNLTGSCNTTEIQFTKVVIRRARDLDNRLEINLENFVGDNRKVQYFTGIKTYAQMASIYDDVKPELSASTLTKFKVFYITLVRLRLNLNFGYFAFTFNVSVKAISDAFKCGLQALYSRLVPLIECPERQILSNRDESFQQLIEENDLYAIVDCREFQVSKLPGTRTIESVKFLFGYTIQGKNFVNVLQKIKYRLNTTKLCVY